MPKTTDEKRLRRTGKVQSAGDVAQRLLEQLHVKTKTRPSEAVELWQSLVGHQFAGMTRAVRLDAGVLYVEVSNSSLLSILHTSPQKHQWIHDLRAHGVEVTSIAFRIG